MHILITSWRDIKNPLSGGAEILTHELAKRVVKKGHTVTIVSPKFPYAKIQENIDGVTIIRPTYFQPTGFIGYLRWPLFLNEVKKIIHTHLPKVDVIIDQIHGLPSFTPVYSNKPILLFLLEVAGEIWDYEVPFPANHFGKFLENWYLNTWKNYSFIVISSSVSAELQKHGIKNINLVTPGVNTPPNISHKKTTYPSFISLGRITPMKRLDDTLKAFSLFHHDNPKSQLHIIGSGKPNYQNQLNNLTKTLYLSKEVKFHGYLSEKKKFTLLAKSWALLSTSIKEGFGLNVLEAAIVNTPTIAYSVPGIIDAVKNNQTGLLTKENTPESLTKSMEEFCKNKNTRTMLGGKAANFAKTFTWEKSTTQFLTAIHNTLNAQP